MIKTEINVMVKVSNDDTVKDIPLDESARQKIATILQSTQYPFEDIYQDVEVAKDLYFSYGQFDAKGVLKAKVPPLVLEQTGLHTYFMAKLFISMKPLKGKINEAVAFDLDVIEALSRLFTKVTQKECLAIGIGGKDIESLYYNHGANLFNVIADLQDGRINSAHVKVTSQKKILLVSYDMTSIAEQTSDMSLNMERYLSWLGYFRACNEYFDFAGIPYKVIKGLSAWLLEGTTIAENDILDTVQDEMQLHRQTYGEIPKDADTAVKITEYHADWFGACVTMFVFSEEDNQPVAIDMYQHVRKKDTEVVEHIIQSVCSQYLNVQRETSQLELSQADIKQTIKQLDNANQRLLSK
jgi:hypothetical protein